MNLFVESGKKAKLSIYHHLLSDSEEFKRFTRPIKSTEYSYPRQSRFLGASMREEVSLLQLCALGHGLNENIYLIGEDSGIGIPERNLYATFSYSRGEPIEFIVIPIDRYLDKVKDLLTDLFSNIVKKKTKNFLWQSLIENPYNKVYGELIKVFSGNSIKVNSNFIEYRITKK